jgi:lipoic acid synthetase
VVVTKKPDWIRVKGVDESVLNRMKDLLDRYHLHTVCESAVCPNMGTCFKAGTATFMILGNVCTRSCAFCGVAGGELLAPVPEEPLNVARAAKELDLKHVVITSVTRDDLADGGANQFAETIKAINRLLPEATTDVLVPDLKGTRDNLAVVISAGPDILAHNLETVPRLYETCRQQAVYETSLKVLENAKELDPQVFTKSGLMLGLGETGPEVLGVMQDLRSTGCDFLTLGQYLRPAADNVEVKEFIQPEVFDEYRQIGEEMGFRFVASSPFVRSSFHAEEALKHIRKQGL